MKKKTTVLLTLAVGLLVGAAVAAPVSTFIVRANESNAPTAVASYDIDVQAVEGVSIEVVSEAQAGSVVDLNAAITGEDIESIEAIYVNGLQASALGNGQFRFVMPSAPAVITANVNYKDLPGAFSITHIVGKGINFTGLPNSADLDDEISFTITFDAYCGYTWDGTVDVYALDSEGQKGQSVEVVHDDTGLFTFTMPDSDVYVDVGIEARAFSITKSSENVGNADILNAFGTVSAVIEDAEGKEELKTVINAGSSALRGRALAGSKIRVPLKDTAEFKVLGLKIVETGEELLLGENATYVEFNLPGRNITLQVLAETRRYEIDVTNSEHITIEVYHQTRGLDGEVNYVLDDGEKPTVTYKETVYVRAVSSNPAFGVGKLQWTAYEEGRETPVFDRALDLGREGFYVFTSNGVMSSQSLAVYEIAALDDGVVTLNQAEHVSVVLTVQSGDQFVPVDENNRIFPNNRLYFATQSSDPAFGLKEAVVKYKEAGDDRELTLSTSIDSVTGLQYITVPQNIGELSVTVSEQPYFDQYGFAGKYVGKSVSVYNNTASDLTYFNKITPWGTGLFNTRSSFAIRSVTPAADGATYGTFSYRKSSAVYYSGGEYNPPLNQDQFTTETEYLASYSSRFVVTTEKTDAVLPEGNSSSISIGIKADDAVSAAPTVAFDTVVDNDNNRWYIVTSAYEDGVYGVLAINNTLGIVYNNDNLSITFNGGESIDAEDANYEIFDGENSLLQIGKINGESVILDGYQGVYACGEQALVLDGVGNAVFGDVEAKYTISTDDSGVVATFSTSEVVGDTFITTVYTADLNVEGKTALVTSNQNVKALANPVITYSNSNPFTYDPETGKYTSGNKGAGSSNSYMYITCEKAGVLSFDYVTGGEGGFDYATVKNGAGETIYTSKTSGTKDNHAEGHLEIEVAAGEQITIMFQKDSSGNVGMDSIEISNLRYFVEVDE